MSFLLSLVLILGFCFSASAQTVTAPFSPDQRLINPAVGPFRTFRGTSLSWSRNVDEAKTSESTTETTVDTYTLGGDFKTATMFVEFNVLPQFGTKGAVGSGSAGFGSSEGSAKRTITLVPVEILVAKNFGDWFSIGFKLVGTSADFSTDDNSRYSYNGTIQTRKTVGKRKDLFLAPSLGGLLRWQGLSIGGSAEFLTFDDDEDSVITETQTSSASTQTTTSTRKKAGTTSMRKDLVGVGYTGTFGAKNIFRIEASREVMPRAPNSYVENGSMDRLVAETTWMYFQAGFEVTNQKGYYLDATHLIPYFFDEQSLTNEAVLAYRFFGGFKTVKGHSAGLSYSQSTKTKQESPGFGSNKIPVEHKYTDYSVSYMYVF